MRNFTLFSPFLPFNLVTVFVWSNLVLNGFFKKGSASLTGVPLEKKGHLQQFAGGKSDATNIVRNVSRHEVTARIAAYFISESIVQALLHHLFVFEHWRLGGTLYT